jgi:hypothetical protein
MLRATQSYELRRHPRAQLQLPVRVRWQGPFGMRLEVAQTVDLSREGLLILRADACAVCSRVWVIYPFRPSVNASAQPETSAHVTRVEASPEGYRVALHLELPPKVSPRSPIQERRTCARAPFALPIFVRPLGSPWPEESMTQDISRSGARFESSHIYTPGDRILAKISWGEWMKAGEITGRVMRVGPMKNHPGPAPLADPASGKSAVLTSVAVRWTRSSKF